MADKNRLDRLADATSEELLEELRRRRTEALRDCSDDEIEAALTERGVERDGPPRLVEK